MSGTASKGTLEILQMPAIIIARVNNAMMSLFFIEKEIILLIMINLDFKNDLNVIQNKAPKKRA